MSQEPDNTIKEGTLSSQNEESGQLGPLPQMEEWEHIHQVFYQGKNYYRVIDVIAALEVSTDAADYWSTMKRRIKTEGFNETRQEMLKLELKSPQDKRLRKHDYATRQTILRLLQSIPGPRVEEFKTWLAQIGELRLRQEEIDRVEAE